HRVELAVLAARDDDRRLADKCRLVVADFGQFVGEREILPARPEKDALQFGPVDVGVGKDAVGHPRIALFWPFERSERHRRSPTSSSRCAAAGYDHRTGRASRERQAASVSVSFTRALAMILRKPPSIARQSTMSTR